MADFNLNFTIPSAKVQLALQGFLKIYPNKETKDDPNWTPIEGETAPQVPKYTDPEWVKERIRRWLVKDIKRGLEMLRNETVSQIEDTTGIIN